MIPLVKLVLEIFTFGNYKNSEYISRYGLYLPSGLGTSDKDINYVSKCVKKIKKRFNF